MYCPELYLREDYDPEVWNQKSGMIDIPNTSVRNNQKFGLSDFIKSPNITNFFVIIVGIGTMISLLPIFLDSFLGSNWLGVLLKTEYGFFALLLMLISVFSGAIFMVIMLIYIAYEFYQSVLKQDYTKNDKIISTFYIAVFLISLLSICLFLLNIWVIKAFAEFNFIYSVSIFLISSFIAIFFIISGEYILLNEIITNKANRNEIIEFFTSIWNLFRQFLKRQTRIRVLLNVCTVVLILIVVYLIFLAFSPPISSISNYYTEENKTLNVQLWDNNSITNNNSPLLIPIHYSPIHSIHSSNLGLLDLYYLNCDWTTNYGHFVKISDDFTRIDDEPQEMTISGCHNSTDNIFWTYDVSDYGKSKPDVFIGIRFTDANKGEILGRGNLNLTWESNDSIKKYRVV